MGARAFRRSAGAWFLLSLLFSPIAGAVFLLVAGPPQGAPVEDASYPAEVEAIEEEKEQEMSAAREMSCPNCGAAINPYTGKGIAQRDEKQPWALSCEKCREPLPENLL
jgi:hypothetical protein